MSRVSVSSLLPITLLTSHFTILLLDARVTPFKFKLVPWLPGTISLSMNHLEEEFVKYFIEISQHGQQFSYETIQVKYIAEVNLFKSNGKAVKTRQATKKRTYKTSQQDWNEQCK